MKSILLILLFIFSLVLPGSCSVRSPAPEPVIIENTKTITQVVKDTIYKVEADSSFYNAYVECINGKPVLMTDEDQGYFQTQLKQEKLSKSRPGKYLDIPKVNLQNGLLTVNCEKRAQELFKQWRETYTKENEKKTITQYVEKNLKWYQKSLMWFGGISLVLFAVGLVLFIKK